MAKGSIDIVMNYEQHSPAGVGTENMIPLYLKKVPHLIEADFGCKQRCRLRLGNRIVVP